MKKEPDLLDIKLAELAHKYINCKHEHIVYASFSPLYTFNNQFQFICKDCGKQLIPARWIEPERR